MLPTDTATGKNPQLFSFPDGCGVHATVRGLSSWAALVAVLLAGSGCGRTQLEPFQQQPVVDAATPMDRPADLGSDVADAPGRDMPPDLPPDLPADLPPDMAMDVPVDRGMDAMSVPDAPPACQPQARDLQRRRRRLRRRWSTRTNQRSPAPTAATACCVGGAYSDCPRRCDVCVPGSKRTCITSFCTFWGNQTCAADGRSFGACKETQAPAPCREVAEKMMRSPELEKCCIDNGYCCVDEFDLNNDGDRTEMLGRCEAVVCDPEAGDRRGGAGRRRVRGGARGARRPLRQTRPRRHGAARRRHGRAAERDARRPLHGVGGLPGRGGGAGASRTASEQVLPATLGRRPSSCCRSRRRSR